MIDYFTITVSLFSLFLFFLSIYAIKIMRQNVKNKGKNTKITHYY